MDDKNDKVIYNICEIPEDTSDDRINAIRDPFSNKSYGKRQLNQKQSKRTQRYRSTAKSRISTMSVGDVRYSFCQLRAAGDDLTSKLVLYNGQTAGEFALSYLIETSNSMRKRRKHSRQQEENRILNETKGEQNNENFPPSQLPVRKEEKEISRYVDFS